jgi:putative ABC transport system permease protein
MSLGNLVILVLENLSRRKARVALTAIGVIIGTAAIVVLVSMVIGLQRNATEGLLSSADLTQIWVNPGYSETAGPPDPRTGEMPGFVPITEQVVAQIEAIPGVKKVVRRDYSQFGMLMRYGRLEGGAGLLGVDVTDLSQMGLQAQEGSLVLERGTIIMGYYVPKNNFYDPRARPGQEPPPPPDLLDKIVRLDLTKWDQQGQEIRKSVQLRVVGILSETRGEADWNIYTHLEDVTAWNDWFMGRRTNRAKDGYNSLLVQVEDISQTIEVNDQIVAMGLMAYTPSSIVQGTNSFFLVLQVIFGGVGAVALLVAAIGIANTMAMAILERTREIGLMKAVGATNRDVLSIFLGEAAGIGLIGGLGGVVVGWSAGQIINVLGQVYLAGQATQQPGGMGATTISVSTPGWLLVFALVFATLVGLGSGIYPALRAATIIPVEALKYE